MSSKGVAFGLDIDHGSGDAGHDDSDGEAPLTRQSTAFGQKTITYWGSFCLNLNNIMGAAVVLLPLVNQSAGFFTPTVAMALVFVFSSFAATMLCDAIQRMPGNRRFRKRVEFCSVVEHYWGRSWYYFTQVTFNLSLQASNIAAMIVASQIIDNFIMRVFGHSWGLEYSKWEFVQSGQDYEDPWPSMWTISLGFLVNMVICIPFGWLNLDENMWFQWFSFVGLVGFTLEFVGQFVLNAFDLGSFDHWHSDGLGTQLTPFFKGGGQAQVLGLSVFAYAWVVTVPSWINEKKAGVSVNSAVWWPSFVGLIMKVAVGLLGAWAFVLLVPSSDGRAVAKTGSDNILNLLSGDSQPTVTVYSAYFWNLTTMVPGIPVLAIMVRYNLLNGDVCGPKASFFFGVVFPWIVTAFCYNASILVKMCTWVAIVVQGFVNLVLPAALYRSALLKYPLPQDRRGKQARAGGSQELLDPSTYSAVGTYDDLNIVALSRGSGSLNGNANVDEARVDAVPAWIPLSPLVVANIIIYFFGFLCVAVIAMDIVSAVKGGK